MKRYLLIISVAFCLMFSCGNYALAQSTLEDSVVEIGTLVNNKQYDTALKKVNEAITTYPNEADFYYWRGTILSEKKKYMEALSDFDKAIELNPEDMNYRISRGMCMADIGNRTGAVDELNYIIKLDPKNGVAYSLRAMLKLDLGDFDGAMADMKLSDKYLKEDLERLKSK